MRQWGENTRKFGAALSHVIKFSKTDSAVVIKV